MKLKIEKMFDECAKEFGSIVLDDIELALIEDAYPDGTFDDWCFYALAMDKDGNLWELCWYPKPNADEYDDYYNQVADWSNPDVVELIEKGYFLDD